MLFKGQVPSRPYLILLLRPGDQGGHAGTGCGVLPGHGLAAGTPLRQSGVETERMGTSPYMAGAGHDDLHPRVLEPYPTTPVGPLGTVNPFWSASVQQAAKGESHVRESEVARGQHPAPSPGLGHVERLRERILREAEETFAREVKKMRLGIIYLSAECEGGGTARASGGACQAWWTT